MDISIGSFKFRLEILIGIVVVYWILCGHLFAGCCRVGLLEAFTGIAAKTTAKINDKVIKNKQKIAQKIAQKNTKEGFTSGNNSATGPEFSDAKSPGYIMNPSNWSMPTLTYSPGTAPDAGVKEFWNRPKQPIPLPEGELDMFATTEFKPECCPNTYSSSTGCACMTDSQYNYLITRGSNNVPYSEY